MVDSTSEHIKTVSALLYNTDIPVELAELLKKCLTETMVRFMMVL
jgi:hypothetical protein